jgi:excisionase family DNA binding protein
MAITDQSGLWMTADRRRSAGRLAPRHRHRKGSSTVTMASDRFLTLADVAEILNISGSQAYALVRNGELQGIKVGGRGQWRIERDKLESYIARMYDETKLFVEQHPFVESESELS